MIKAIYLFLIASLVGVEISIGAFVAPTIFFPDNLIGSGVLTHFQSGQLMSAIFVKYNKFLIAICVISLIFEMVKFNNNKKLSFYNRFSTLMIALLNLILGLLFVLFFTDYILSAQNNGAAATVTTQFLQIHKASEWCMKIMMIAQVFLFFINFSREKEPKKQNLGEIKADESSKI